MNTALEPGEKESEYEGGIGSWAKYLTANLKYPQRAMALEKSGMVKLFFTVDEAAKPNDVFVFKSVEYSID